MNASNGFREDELVSRRVKVGNEWQTRVFPVVGGRLRLAHEENQDLGLQTEMVSWDGQYAIFKCCAVTAKGQFVGYGTANSQRDARLADSLIELAETRSIARALRFAGYGLEFTGAEEVSHVMPDTEQAAGRHENKEPKPILQSVEQLDKAETKPAPQPRVNGNGNGSKATQAQCRALYALTRKAKYEPEDLNSMLSPLNAARFEDLTVADASRLIQYLQTEVAA